MRARAPRRACTTGHLSHLRASGGAILYCQLNSHSKDSGLSSLTGKQSGFAEAAARLGDRFGMEFLAHVEY
jgi:hypothetical protein